ncbi:MAG TPA: hypothetical protein VGJ94_16650 [Syntrophorhabdaceae bacterium]|jgi:hypothetical protein
MKQLTKNISSHAPVSHLTELIGLMVSLAITIVGLIVLSWNCVDLNNFAKGEENTAVGESYKGRVFAASNLDEIRSIVLECCTMKWPSVRGQGIQRVLWLGNSQLHYINQYKPGDHLAPYWLRISYNPDYFEPLGFSLPNANFQEFYILSQFVSDRASLSGLIMELVFDDLREDKIRRDFSKILSADLIESIRRNSKVGAIILDRFAMPEKEGKDSGILTGTIQKPVETWLTRQMSSHWHLWAERAKIEGDFLVGLYYFRNWVFCIKPTSERKIIKARYNFNMQALSAILEDYRRRKIPVLMYIAPIRQDHPIPYNLQEYKEWKDELAIMANRYGAHLVNLERAVPDDKWGSYHKDDIDFMHFRGPGHRIVADELLPHVKGLLKWPKP